MVEEVRFRLLRRDDAPATNPLSLAFRFGLQDTKGEIVAGERQPDGSLVFDFTLTAKEGREPGSLLFGGRFASGPVGDRFVYLSWWALERGEYINRVKARLSNLDWEIVRASREQDRPITADLTGWLPGDARKFVPWSLGDVLSPGGAQREGSRIETVL